MRHHDLVIIGAGSGNAVIDESFADLDIGLIEARAFGGTCVNYGCIPSKMLAHTAELTDDIAAAADFDIDTELPSLRWSDLQDRVFGRTDRIATTGRQGRKDSVNITVYDGHAEFTGPRQLRVDGYADPISADQIVVAAGGRPIVPPVVAESGLPFETSDTIMRINHPPTRLAVLGGGYIASELAHVLAAAGSEITIIEKSDLLLGAPQDDEIRQIFTDLWRRRHDVRLGTELSGMTGDAHQLELTLDDGSTVTADMLLVAVGRRPNGDRLNLSAAGIDTHDDGRIAVDEFCRTSAAGVFALGDISTEITLKHVANREADIVKHNLRHPDRLRAVDHRRVPSAVFTKPQLASVGMTEKDCARAHPDYRVGITRYRDVAYGWALQDDTGLCKVLVDGDHGRILGAHIIGEQAASMIQLFAVAMEFGISAHDMAHRPYWVHPALTEVVENALLDAGRRVAA